MSHADKKPTLDSDIAAFKLQHPYIDRHHEKVVADIGNTTLVRTLTSFEIFTFSAPETGEIVFDVRGIKDALAAGKLQFQMMEGDIDEGWADHTRKNNGVEAERMASLTAEDLERPGIAVFWPHNECVTLIDGNNRLVRRWDDGLQTFRFALVPLSKELLPFACRPGEEEKFLNRRGSERGLTPVGPAIRITR